MAVRGGTYEDTQVVIDGNQYIDCIFNRCHMIFQGIGAVTQMQGCKMNDCIFGFAGPAAITLDFLKALANDTGTKQIWEEIKKGIESAPPGNFPSTS